MAETNSLLNCRTGQLVPGVRIPPSPRDGCECDKTTFMFDFEKLEVYQVVKSQNVKALALLNKLIDIDPYIKDQWKRASLGILTNLAEGTGRMTPQDKKNFYTMARGCVFECAAILDIMHETGIVDEASYQDLYAGYEQCSKMLLAMYRSMDKQQEQDPKRHF